LKQDWELQDILISRKLGVTRERVWQKRREIGLPDPVNFHKRTYETGASRIRDAFKAHPDWTPAMIARKAGTPVQYVSVQLKNCGRNGSLTGRKHPWGRMNFELPNAELTRIWGMKDNIVASHRYRTGTGTARWDERFAMKGGSGFDKAVALEQLKAKQWRKEQE
jgi:hypothetical protein